MDFSTIAIFVQVADHLSLSEAASRLGLTASGVSRALTRLESRVGVKLMTRSPRGVKLTSDGAEFHVRCRQLLADMEMAVSTVSKGRTTPRGRLRLQCPVGFGKHVVIPALPAFMQRYPELVIDLQLDDRQYDLTKENIDVAIRVGHVRDTKLVAKRLCRTRFITCASPDYLARHGEPSSPAELSGHRCIGYFNAQTGRYREWGYVEDAVERWRPVHGPINISTADGLLDAALNGCGIATMTTFVAAQSVASGHLVIVLKNYTTVGPDISIVYPPQNRTSAPARALINFLVDLVPKQPLWEQMINDALGASPRRRVRDQ
ncbi:HTH-type transcriptional regulator DmlR [Pigmentiphaga humi]|uniref:HTH-type transcriptional regulator DmlR n=1 Tax=Pigmentiphaga humi TaxID=2478468 RepID=A0A3P4AXB5_9BURK|nr:LysR family transcriptional regulator [Pigmentiphaga humi]VCU68040.1 HTH-type transcriptional regulator DmlR [Pigmentiphaga humi]